MTPKSSPNKKTPSSGQAGSDQVKDRFKAALEKKQNASKGSGTPVSGGERAIGPHSTNGKTQQMFRRKSGSS